MYIILRFAACSIVNTPAPKVLLYFLLVFQWSYLVCFLLILKARIVFVRSSSEIRYLVVSISHTIHSYLLYLNISQYSVEGSGPILDLYGC